MPHFFFLLSKQWADLQEILTGKEHGITPPYPSKDIHPVASFILLLMKLFFHLHITNVQVK